MDGQSRKQLLEELQPLGFALWCISAARTVDQFYQSDDGDSDLGVSHYASNSGEHLPCVLPLARLQSARWNRGSVPCWRFQRFAVAIDGRFDILGEVSVHDRWRALG